VVYRRLQEGGVYDLGGARPATAPGSFSDAAVAPGQAWCYVVRIRVSATPLIESKSSNEVCVEVKKTTPPQAPVALTALPQGGAIELRWSPSTDHDLASYRLYRAKEGAPQRLAEIPKTETTFVDRSAEPGVLYHYTVTAIDTSGNESAPSTPTDGRLP
jgi:fibronectin type 3 domain-containing protein